METGNSDSEWRLLPGDFELNTVVQPPNIKSELPVLSLLTIPDWEHDDHISAGNEAGPEKSKKRRRLDDNSVDGHGDCNENSDKFWAYTRDYDTPRDPFSPSISGLSQDPDNGQITFTVTIPKDKVPKDFRLLQSSRVQAQVDCQFSQYNFDELSLRMEVSWDPTPFEISLLADILNYPSCKLLRKLYSDAEALVRNPRPEKIKMSSFVFNTRQALGDAIWWCMPVTVAYVLACKGALASKHGLAGEAGKGKVTVRMVAQCLSWLGDYIEDYVFKKATEALVENPQNAAEFLKTWYKKCHGLREMPRILRHLYATEKDDRAELEKLWEKRIGYYSEVCLGDYLVELRDETKYALMRCD